MVLLSNNKLEKVQRMNILDDPCDKKILMGKRTPDFSTYRIYVKSLFKETYAVI